MSAKKNTNNSDQTNDLSEETKKEFYNALEDVHTRFILNLPPEELETSDRLFFQLEQAWWYYEDIICDEMEEHEIIPSNNPETLSYAAATKKVHLPRFKKLQPFCRKVFEIFFSSLLPQFDELWNEFSRYRRKISTYGTILLNSNCTKVILCQDYSGKSWTFPAGKVNQHEKGIEAGARETYEETGFDPNCNLGQTKVLCDVNPNLPWKELKEEDALRYTENDGSGKLRTCYVCHGVPEDFPFAPVARKEVLAVEWHDLNDLPKRSFAVMPFIKGLRKWIRKNVPKEQRSKTPAKEKGQEKRASSRAGSKSKRDKSSTKKRAGSKGKDRSNSRNSRYSTPGKSIISDNDDDLIQSGLGAVGEENRWSEDDMFRVNEKLIGRKIEYDGNPQVFATKGFNGKDPHAFRVVGGSFMNSGKSTIAEAPDKEALQPLYRVDDESRSIDSNGNDGFKPFFSDGLEASWDGKSASTEKKGKTSKPKKEEKGSITNASGLAILSMLRGKPSSAEPPRTIPAVNNDKDDESNGDLDVFMTDREITSRSQQEKTKSIVAGAKFRASEKGEDEEQKENEHFTHMREWVKNLPETNPTKVFGDFRFDVDAILKAMKTK